MLSALAGTVITQIANGLIGKALEAFVAYNNKQISLAELQAKVQHALLDTIKEVEKAQADALARTYASFMDAAKTSPTLQVTWAAVTLSQLVVLLWHQLGIPAFSYVTGERYPSSGTTVEWAYLLVAGLLGLGPVVMNNGPGRVPLDRFKALIGK